MNPKRWREADPAALERRDPEVARAADLLRRVRVPEPSEGARKRVWDRLARRGSSPILVWRWPLVAALAASAIFLFWLRWNVRPSVDENWVAVTPKSSSASEVDPRTDAGTLSPARRPIVTRVGQHERVPIASYGALELSSSTEIKVDASGERVRVDLVVGSLKTAPARDRTRPLSIVASAWSVRAEAGAVFRMERVGTDGISVAVDEGVVLLTGPIGDRQMHAGDAFESEKAHQSDHANPSSPSCPSKATRPSAREKDRAMSALYHRAVQEQDASDAIALFSRVAKEEGPFKDVAAMQAVRRAVKSGRCVTAIELGERLIEEIDHDVYRTSMMVDVLECRLKLEPIDVVLAKLELFVARYPQALDTPEVRFYRADIKRRLARCAEAEAEYGEIRSGRFADDAAFYRAWCSLREGSPAARENFEHYLRQFPSGAHGVEAQKALERLR